MHAMNTSMEAGWGAEAEQGEYRRMGAIRNDYRTGYQAGFRAALKRLRAGGQGRGGGYSTGVPRTSGGYASGTPRTSGDALRRRGFNPAGGMAGAAAGASLGNYVRGRGRGAGGGSQYVRAVQQKLGRLFGQNLALSGRLDLQERSLLRRFQRLNGLPVTGLLDKNTRRMLAQAKTRDYRHGTAAPGGRLNQAPRPSRQATVTGRGLPRPQRRRPRPVVDDPIFGQSGALGVSNIFGPAPAWGAPDAGYAAPASPALDANPFAIPSASSTPSAPEPMSPAPVEAEPVSANPFAPAADAAPVADGADGAGNSAEPNPAAANPFAPTAGTGDIGSAVAPADGTHQCTCQQNAATAGAEAPAAGAEGEIPQAVYQLLLAQRGSPNFAQYDSYKKGGRRAGILIDDLVQDRSLDNQPAAYLITFNHQGQRKAYSGHTGDLRGRMVKHLHALNFPVGKSRNYTVYYQKTATAQQARQLERNLNAQRAALSGVLVNLTTELEAELFI